MTVRIFGAAFLYFALVFVAAFALGTVRTFWLEPALGETWAVACEIPILVVVMFFAARFVGQRLRPAPAAVDLIAIGLLGLVLQQGAEFALVVASGETLASHIAYLRTPAGMIYVAALIVFVLMPLLVRDRRA